MNQYRHAIARYRVCLEIDVGRAALSWSCWKVTDASLGAMNDLIERLEVEIEGASLAVHPPAGLALEAVQIMRRARWVFEEAYRGPGSPGLNSPFRSTQPTPPLTQDTSRRERADRVLIERRSAASWP